MNIRNDLYNWRDREAKNRNVESFRILPNTTLDEIILLHPKNKEELCKIKGIKELKFAQFGQSILNILNGISSNDNNQEDINEQKYFTVGQFLTILNSKFSRINVRIKGEVSSFNISGKAVYFTIKDNYDDSTMSAFMWLSDYKIFNININIGDEVILSGGPDIYKPSGRLSFKANTIELAGEGVLKKAYDELKKKLELEGLFREERKKKILPFPNKIGLITSKQGAVIYDFLNNLGKYGLNISFVDSRVEGVLAVKDIVSAIRVLSKKDIDVLVIIRGGGSLESLQAFNNEIVVREISKCKVPVICAIGHDKDIPLAQLVSDYSPSTPSLCTEIINSSYEEAKYNIDSYIKKILSIFQLRIYSAKNLITRTHHDYVDKFQFLIESINSVIKKSDSWIILINNAILQIKKNIDSNKNRILSGYIYFNNMFKEKILSINKIIDAYNPINILKVGYGILYLNNKVLKSINNVDINDDIEAKLYDGVIKTKVIKIQKYEEGKQ